MPSPVPATFAPMLKSGRGHVLSIKSRKPYLTLASNTNVIGVYGFKYLEIQT